MTDILTDEEIEAVRTNVKPYPDSIIQALLNTLDQRTKERDELQGAKDLIFKRMEFATDESVKLHIENDELKRKVGELVHSKGLIFSLAEDRRFENEELKRKVEDLEAELQEERSSNIGPYSFKGISEALIEIKKLKEENAKLRERIDGVCGDCSYWGVGGQEGRFRDCRMDKRVHKINDGCQEWTKANPPPQ